MAPASRPNPRPLGEVQRAWLRSVNRQGGAWWEGCGYTWTKTSRTLALCESLVGRGLMERTSPSTPRHVPRYKLTAAGITAAMQED